MGNSYKIEDHEVISKHRGYEVRKCTIVEGEYEDVLETRLAFSTKDGGYIGEPKLAAALDRKGILPEKAHEEDDTCTIGYAAKEDVWINLVDLTGSGVLPFDSKRDAAKYITLMRESVEDYQEIVMT